MLNLVFLFIVYYHVIFNLRQAHQPTSLRVDAFSFLFSFFIIITRLIFFNLLLDYIVERQPGGPTGWLVDSPFFVCKHYIRLMIRVNIDNQRNDNQQPWRHPPPRRV